MFLFYFFLLTVFNFLFSFYSGYILIVSNLFSFLKCAFEAAKFLQSIDLAASHTL